ncbi:MAG TPA: energy transducer TonB, partial [Gemmatimonadales bacterium]|nr:energy transducer TonB [Gemmatimonadales bacterium]
AVERSRYCPPLVISGGNEILRFDVWAEDRPPVNGGHPTKMTIQATLSEVGDVVRTDILRSSGIQELDNEFAQSFARQKFMPALLDSVPVTSWIRSDGKTLKL